MQNKKNSPLKTQKNFLKSQYLVDNYLSFQSIFSNEYFPKIQVISTLKQAEKAFKSQNSSDQIAERTDNHEHI